MTTTLSREAFQMVSDHSDILADFLDQTGAHAARPCRHPDWLEEELEELRQHRDRQDKRVDRMINDNMADLAAYRRARPYR